MLKTLELLYNSNLKITSVKKRLLWQGRGVYDRNNFEQIKGYCGGHLLGQMRWFLWKGGHEGKINLMSIKNDLQFSVNKN